ncbi:hypothetical protein [Saccharibacillus deserti]|uniref:hypothetical protein n=1 Tax=Saccharibacillus deserti TaxID=1634444 RepID=UPI001554D3C8|nr:hypothetical protein [Saccharibacillus deserti]
MILASATEDQYDLYSQEADIILDAVNGYSKQPDLSYVFNEQSMAIIDEKKGLIEVKPLIKASSSESEIIRTKRLLD